MALDEPKETDTVYDIEGFSYLVDTEFIEKVKPIKVDFVDIGFRLSCSVDFQPQLLAEPQPEQALPALKSTEHESRKPMSTKSTLMGLTFSMNSVSTR